MKLLIASLALTCCAVGQGPQWEKERALGRALSAQFEREYRLYEQPDVTAYVQRLASRLGPPTLSVRIFDSREPVRAVLPGGPAYLSTSLLAGTSTEAELAAVLAHLIAHVRLGPLRRPMTDGQIPFVFLGGSGGMCLRDARTGSIFAPGSVELARDLEDRADLLSAKTLREAGYDGPNAVVTTSSYQRMIELLPRPPIRKPPSLLRSASADYPKAF